MHLSIHLTLPLDLQAYSAHLWIDVESSCLPLLSLLIYQYISPIPHYHSQQDYGLQDDSITILNALTFNATKASRLGQAKRLYAVPHSYSGRASTSSFKNTAARENIHARNLKKAIPTARDYQISRAQLQRRHLSWTNIYLADWWITSQPQVVRSTTRNQPRQFNAAARKDSRAKSNTNPTPLILNQCVTELIKLRRCIQIHRTTKLYQAKALYSNTSRNI